MTEKFATATFREVDFRAEDFANYMEHVQDVSSLEQDVREMASPSVLSG